MAEPTAGITRATSFGEREPPASRLQIEREGASESAYRQPCFLTFHHPLIASEADEDEKHELDTMA